MYTVAIIIVSKLGMGVSYIRLFLNTVLQSIPLPILLRLKKFQKMQNRNEQIKEVLIASIPY